MNKRISFLALAVAVIFGVYFSPPAAFVIDDALYIEMAHAMAMRGELFLFGGQHIPEAPPLPYQFTNIVNGEAYPHYPSGYAILAAPFYLLLGIRGLVLMNALGALGALWLTGRIASHLYNDKWIARIAILILGGASFLSGYAFAIWPHAMALFLILGGVALSIEAVSNQTRKRTILLACSGLVLGFAISVRIDIFLAILAVFCWLRFFALPANRRATLVFLVGLVPGFVFSAWLNALKFGEWTPLTYGVPGGATDPAAYLSIALAAGGIFVTALIVNVPAVYKQYVAGRIQRKWWVGASIIIACLGFLWADALKYLRAIYVLLVDLQANDNPIPLNARDENGYIPYWGLTKKALLQSLPFAALSIIPVVEFFRGKNSSSHAYSLLMIAAFVAFYALNQWHGGMSYNMRYFLPAVPFIAILSAYGLRNYAPVFATHPNLLIRTVIAGLILNTGFNLYGMKISPALATPLELYPPLIIFLILLGVVVFHMRSGGKRSEFFVAALSGVALSYAGLLSLTDLGGYIGIRAAKIPFEQAHEAAIAPGSLVISNGEVYLVHARANGVDVAHASAEGREILHAAADAYLADGRCVYVHTAVARHYFSEDPEQPLVRIGVPKLIEKDDEFGMFTFSAHKDKCDFSGPDT